MKQLNPIELLSKCQPESDTGGVDLDHRDTVDGNQKSGDHQLI